MYRIFFQLLLSLGCIFLFIECNAQTNSPGLKIFKLEENNLSHKIYSICKNHQGRIFLGTSNGLYEFDGIRFTAIPFSKKSAADTITAIFEDHQNKLWVGMRSGRIAQYYKNQLSYTEPQEGFPKKQITDFIEDRQNRIWFSTKGEGIYYYNNNKLYLVNEANGLSDLNIHSLALSNTGNVLGSSDQGIQYCTFRYNKVTVRAIGPNNGLPDYLVTTITSDNNNNFWIGHQDKGISYYNQDSEKVVQPPLLKNWNYGQINQILKTSKNIWVATQDSGLRILSADGNTFYNAPLKGITQKQISKLIEDNEGNIWAIADNNYIIRSAGNLLTLYPAYNNSTYQKIHTILSDSKGNIWTGYDMAVLRFEGKDFSTMKKFPIHELNIKSDVTSLYEDPYHHLWIGTMGGGLFLMDIETGKYRRLNELSKTGFTDVLSITGAKNTVCVGGLQGGIIIDLNSENQKLETPYQFTIYNNFENLGSPYIYTVFKDSKNRIWFGTDGKGISMLENGKFTNFDDREILRDDHIYAIIEDDQQHIWFSTGGAGIYKFDGLHFTHYGVKQGLSNLAISTLKYDGKGKICIVNKKGIDLLDIKTGLISYLNKERGIPELNNDLGGATIAKNGALFICTADGFLEYQPDAKIRTKPKTLLTQIQLFLNAISSENNFFKYDENNFTFTYNGLYFSNPEQVMFQYKLDGLDSNWITT
ncbi:MAG: two-component regulator propeller domain-containing protein, partial [Ferruginibacter sp.]